MNTTASNENTIKKSSSTQTYPVSLKPKHQKQISIEETEMSISKCRMIHSVSHYFSKLILTAVSIAIMIYTKKHDGLVTGQELYYS